jgi:hypothetical protein
VTAKQNGTTIPRAPQLGRVLTQDFTMEALLRELAKAPRGLLCSLDELSDLLTRLNQYRGGKGNDASKLMQMWKHSLVLVDRVNHQEGKPVLCVRNPFLGIVGGINVANLLDFIISGRKGDGFLDRFLVSYPEQIPKPNWSWGGLPDDQCEHWRRLIQRLLDRPMAQNEHGEVYPHLYELDGRGENAWESFYNDHVAETRTRDFPPELRGPWGKFEEYAGRVTQILALVEYAATTPKERYESESTNNEKCGFNWEGAVINAWNFIDYFKVGTQRVLAQIEKLSPKLVGTNESRDIQEVLHWIEKNKRATFQAKELEDLRCFRGDTRRRDKTLDEMVQRNYIRRLPGITLRNSKKPSPSYEVNQALRTWETPQPSLPENNRQHDRHKIARYQPAYDIVASAPTHSDERTSSEEVVPDPENNRQNRQNRQERGNSLESVDLPPPTDDPLFTTDSPSLPSNGDSWEPPSLPSSEDLFSDLLSSSPHTGEFGDFDDYSSQQSSEARSNPLCEDELGCPTSPAPPESAGDFAGDSSPSADDFSPSATSDPSEPPPESAPDTSDHQNESVGEP